MIVALNRLGGVHNRSPSTICPCAAYKCSYRRFAHKIYHTHMDDSEVFFRLVRINLGPGRATADMTIISTSVLSTTAHMFVWYLFAAICTILTRDLNKAGFGSMSISLTQFSVGAVLSASSAILDKSRESLVGTWNPQLKGIICCYALGHILTNYSFLVMQPSFSHTVKASEPVFTVLLSRVLARPNPNTIQMLSLIPIVSGVMIASFSELSFPVSGLLASLSSNLFFSARNVRLASSRPHDRARVARRGSSARSHPRLRRCSHPACPSAAKPDSFCK